jgi:predicted amidohydrolase YtcJ
MAVDLVLYNAQIMTGDRRQPRAEAVAVKGGRIVAVGSRTDLAGLISPAGRSSDCRGKTLLPGLIDAHCHFFSSLRQLFSLDLSPAAVHSIADIQTAIGRKVRYIPAGTWIAGSDYNEFYLAEKRHPTRWELDAVAPDHPVIITHRSLHACVLNSAGLQKIGLSFESEEPPGGLIERDLESGELNGLLFEMLSWVQERLQAPLSAAELDWGIGELNRRWLEAGITSFGDATITNDPAQYQKLAGLVEKRAIQSRVNMMAGGAHLAAFKEKGWRTGSGDARLKIGSLKIVISQATGEMRPGQEELNRMVLAANQAGFQVAIHAVEKSSVEAAVRALEYGHNQQPETNLRNRIEHCSECSPETVARLAAIKAVVVTQPPFLYFQGERYRQETPPEIQPILYPFKWLWEAGLIVAGSSDAPVVSNNPMMGIFAAVTRQAPDGAALLPTQRLSAAQAVAMYTSAPALAQFEENEKGRLIPGQLADMVMLSDNPLDCPPEKIKDIRVEKTLIGGQVVWESTN